MRYLRALHVELWPGARTMTADQPQERGAGGVDVEAIKARRFGSWEDAGHYLTADHGLGSRLGALIAEIERLQQQVKELDSHNLEMRGQGVDLEIERDGLKSAWEIMRNTADRRRADCDQLRARNAVLEAVATAARAEVEHDCDECRRVWCAEREAIAERLRAALDQHPAATSQQHDAY